MGPASDTGGPIGAEPRLAGWPRGRRRCQWCRSSRDLRRISAMPPPRLHDRRDTSREILGCITRHPCWIYDDAAAFDFGLDLILDSLGCLLDCRSAALLPGLPSQLRPMSRNSPRSGEFWLRRSSSTTTSTTWMPARSCSLSAVCRRTRTSSRGSSRRWATPTRRPPRTCPTSRAIFTPLRWLRRPAPRRSRRSWSGTWRTCSSAVSLRPTPHRSSSMRRSRSSSPDLRPSQHARAWGFGPTPLRFAKGEAMTITGAHPGPAGDGFVRVGAIGPTIEIVLPQHAIGAEGSDTLDWRSQTTSDADEVETRYVAEGLRAMVRHDFADTSWRVRASLANESDEPVSISRVIVARMY